MDLIWEGRLLQSRGAETEKSPSPIVLKLEGETERSCWEEGLCDLAVK